MTFGGFAAVRAASRSFGQLRGRSGGFAVVREASLTFEGLR